MSLCQLFHEPDILTPPPLPPQKKVSGETRAKIHPRDPQDHPVSLTHVLPDTESVLEPLGASVPRQKASLTASSRSFHCITTFFLFLNGYLHDLTMLIFFELY